MKTKRRVRPTNGTWYFSIVCFNTTHITSRPWDLDFLDIARWKNHNVFHTRSEAEKKLKEIKRVLKAP